MSTSPPTPTGSPRGEDAARLLEGALKQPATAAERPAPPSVSDLAARFPDLEIEALIGAGGMGVVYRARHRRLDRLVALKILPEALARDPEFAERFGREARMLARLDHPHIVRVHDFGVADGLFFLILEYVDGANLRQVMGAGALSPPEALAIVPQICEALQYAHDQGVVHRDIKPENVLLDRRGQVKIADFGLAKLIGRPGVDTSVTATGQVMGTWQYMAPEQYRTPGDVDHRADIFSLGVVFYEMLTGELPVGVFKSPSQSQSLDARIDAIVLRALERERARRYQHASELRTDVSQLSVPSAAASSAAPPRIAASPTLAAAAANARPGQLAVLLSLLALALGFLAVAVTHETYGGVERGTADAYRREAAKAVAGGVLWLVGAGCGLVATLRAANHRRERRIYRLGLVLLALQVLLLPGVALYALGEARRHSSPRPRLELHTSPGVLVSGVVVRGALPRQDHEALTRAVRKTWAAYIAHGASDAGPWDAARAAALYVQADRAMLLGLPLEARQAQAASNHLGIAARDPARLGAPPASFEVRAIDVDASQVRATVYAFSNAFPNQGGWKFPMARDQSGEWLFAIGAYEHVGGN